MFEVFANGGKVATGGVLLLTGDFEELIISGSADDLTVTSYSLSSIYE